MTTPFLSHDERRAAGQACLDAALTVYLPLGLSVLCCCDPDHVGVGRDHGKTCDSPGKAPMTRWKELQTRLPTATEVRRWWQTFAYSNVGVALGQVSGLVRVDVDGSEGDSLLQIWSQGGLPPTWTFHSSPTGYGLLYAWPKDLPCHSTAHGCPGDHQELRLMEDVLARFEGYGLGSAGGERLCYMRTRQLRGVPKASKPLCGLGR